MEYCEVIKLTKEIHSKLNIDCTTPSKIKVISKSTPQNSLKNIIKDHSKQRLEITIKSLDFLSLQCYGIYEKYRISLDSYKIKILLNSNRGNTCWERYVVAKELSHILIGEESTTWTTDIIQLISELLDGSGFLESSIKDIIETEYVSLVLAMELLVPYCHNNFVIDSSRTSKDVAELFMVPEKIIDFMRKKSYQDLRISTYESLL